MNILLVFFIITFLYAYTYKTKRSLHMLQQNLYNENNRYVKWLIKNKKDFIGLDIISILIAVLEIIILSKTKLISNIGLVVVIILQLLIGIN